LEEQAEEAELVNLDKEIEKIETAKGGSKSLAFKQGHQAFSPKATDQEMLDTNPYTKNKVLREAWESGWASAQVVHDASHKLVED